MQDFSDYNTTPIDHMISKGSVELPYNNLKAFIKNKDIDLLSKIKFIKNIQKLDTEGMEKVHGLILLYHEEHGDEEDTKRESPYGGIVKDTGISYNLLDFPYGLRQLLYKFVCMHVEHLERMKSNENT